MSYLDRVQSGAIGARAYPTDNAYPDFRNRTNNIMLIQYRNSFNLKQYISAFVDMFEDLETALIDTINRRYLDNAQGQQLDDIAEIVGVKRLLPAASPVGYFGYYDNPQSATPSVGDDANPAIGGVLKGDLDPDSNDFILTDLGLYQFIKAKVIKNSSFMSVDDLIEYIEVVLGQTMDIEIVESTTRNAAQIIIHGALSLTERAGIAATIKMMKGAGVEYTMRDNSGEISLVGQPSSVQPYSRFLVSLQI